ncbi:MAG: hypothetical protein HZB42_01365 [Sphingobacteriales bacterium]|nr:hypothetical protein [Sphingobacteriales bacterium]
MKIYLLTGLLFISFCSYSQELWNGLYELEMKGNKKLPDSIKKNMWTKFEVLSVKDSVGKYNWIGESFAGKQIWVLEGVAVEKDTNELMLFVREIKDNRPSWERKLKRRINKEKPMYSINKTGEVYTIKQIQWKEVVVAVKKIK